MRIKTLIPGLKNSDKVRILFSDPGVAVYMTVKEAYFGFGTLSHSRAVESGLKALGNIRKDPGAAGTACVGLCGTWEGINLQIDCMS